MQAEKMKVVAVSALAVCVLGVGAFQFLKPGDAPPAAPAKKAVAKVDDSAPKPILNPVYSAGLAMRDPFTPAPFAKQAHEASLTPAQRAAAHPTPTNVPPLTGVPGGQPPGGVPSGSLPPLPVTGGPATAMPTAPGGNAPETNPAPTFHYRLTGVIDGARPAAIFDDGEGHQRLVAVGGEIGEGATLVKVSPGKAVVRFAGDTLVLHPKQAPKAAAPSKRPSPGAPGAPSGSPAVPAGGVPTLPPGASPDLDAAAKEAAKRLQGDPS